MHFKFEWTYSDIKISDETGIIEHEIMKNDLITNEQLKQIVKNELGTTDIATLAHMRRASTMKGLIFGKPEKASIKQFASYKKYRTINGKETLIRESLR
jgi:hypothetical protein